MRRVTTGDIAQAANVSRTTVSFVLNNRGDKRISPSTREHVLKVATSLGYVPSAASRTLRQGRNNIVVCVLPKLTPTRPTSTIRQLISQSLWKNGLIAAFIEIPEDGVALADLWASFDPAAVLLYEVVSEKDAELLNQARIPFVDGVLDRDSQVLGIEQDLLAKAQINYLANKGHQRIAYVGVDTELESRFLEPRIEGANEAARQRGVHLVTLRLKESSSESFIEIFRHARKEHQITAVAAFNDEVAARVIETARELQLLIPDDLAIIGVDDLEFSAHLDPPLTTVAFHYDEAIERLTAYLMSRLAHVETPMLQEGNSFSVVERESV